MNTNLILLSSSYQNQQISQSSAIKISNLNQFSNDLIKNIFSFLNFQDHFKSGLINKKIHSLSISSLISIHYPKAKKIIELIEEHLPSSSQNELEDKKTQMTKLKMELKVTNTNLPSLKELTIKLGHLKNDLAEYLTLFLETTTSKEVQDTFFLKFQNSFSFLNQNLLEAALLFFSTKNQIRNSNNPNPQLARLIRNNCQNLEEIGYPKLSMKICNLYESKSTKKTLIINFINRKHQDWPFEEILNLALKSIQEIPHKPTKRNIFNSIPKQKSIETNENKLLQFIEIIPENNQTAIESCFKNLLTIYTSKNDQFDIETHFNKLIDIYISKKNLFAVESCFKFLIDFYISTNNQSAIELCLNNLIKIKSSKKIRLNMPCFFNPVIKHYMSKNLLEDALSFSKNFSSFLKEPTNLDLLSSLISFFLKKNQFATIFSLINNHTNEHFQVRILEKMLDFFNEPARIQDIFKNKKLLDFILALNFIDDSICSNYPNKVSVYTTFIVDQTIKITEQLLKEGYWEECIQIISLTTPSINDSIIHLVFAFYDPLKEKTQVNLSDPNISKFIIVFFEKLIKNYMKAWQTHKEVDFYALVNQVNASLKPQFPTINTQPILDVFNSEKEETTNHKTRKRNREDTLDLTQAPSSKTQKTTHNKD